jgi:hypothetical protein
MIDKPLSDTAKNLLTFVGSVFLFNKLGGLASSRELSKVLGYQNINPKLADRLMDEFKHHHDLGDVELKYLKHGGPPITVADVKDGKRTISLQGAKGGMIDDPAVRMHEMAHAAYLKDKAWHTGDLYNAAPAVSQAISAVLAVEGMPIAATLVALFGHVPVLTAEHLASAKARNFLEGKLSKEELARADKILSIAFNTYAIEAASSAVAAGAAAYLNKVSK